MRKQLITLIVGSLAATGVACSTAKADAAENSAYCKEAHIWAVHELDPRDDQNPAWFKPYWSEYLDFAKKASAVAPAAIKDDWAIYNTTIAKETALLEKYGYDQGRAEAEATAEEKKVYQDPGKKANDAFDAVLRYEALTCDAAQPLAADVSFKGQKPGAYCDAVAKDNERIAPAFEQGAHPDALKAVFLSEASKKFDAEALRTAPAVIKDDVKANIAWWKNQQRSVLEKFKFDVRKILLNGSAQDRRNLNLTDQKIRDHFARTLAYEQQVCGQ